MIRQTSIDAYRYLDGEGILGDQQTVIRKHLESYPEGRTLKEISRALGIEINAIAGRVNELKAGGWLVECDKRTCSISGRKVTPVRRKTTKDEAEDLNLFS